MFKKLFNLAVFVVVAILSWYADYTLASQTTYKLLYTSATLVIIYFFFKVLIDEVIVSRISGAKTRYSMRKATSMFQIAIFLIIFIAIWIENVQALFVAYGLIAAGVAVALQDFFKNIMGGILVLTGGIYQAGDRIEVDGKTGDVIDVGIMYTTILEIKEWVAADQATGRLLNIPNGRVLTDIVHNYTKDNTIIWDEIMLPLTYDSDIEYANKQVEQIAKKYTKTSIEKAEQEIKHLSSKYYLTSRDATPSIYIKITDNWVEMYLRYVTVVRERRETYSQLTKEIYSFIQKDKKVSLATTSIKIVK